MQHVLGGKVEKAPVREYGKTETFVDKSSALFGDVSEKTIVWMSHFDYISQVAPGFKIIAHTADCPVAAAECSERTSMQYSSIQKFFIHRKVQRCFTTLCVEYADVLEPGKWMHL